MMNNLRICNKLAEIESISYWNYLGKCVLKAPWAWGEESPEYNPLTDDALCFRLMIKYKLSLIAPEGEQTNWDCIISDILTCEESPNKAICLAIIELNKGK